VLAGFLHDEGLERFGEEIIADVANNVLTAALQGANE